MLCTSPLLLLHVFGGCVPHPSAIPRRFPMVKSTPSVWKSVILCPMVSLPLGTVSYILLDWLSASPFSPSRLVFSWEIYLSVSIVLISSSSSQSENIILYVGCILVPQDVLLVGMHTGRVCLHTLAILYVLPSVSFFESGGLLYGILDGMRLNGKIGLDG